MAGRFADGSGLNHPQLVVSQDMHDVGVRVRLALREIIPLGNPLGVGAMFFLVY